MIFSIFARQTNELRKMTEKVLVTGGLGQIGSQLSQELVNRYGVDNVIITDIKSAPEAFPYQYLKLNVLDKEAIEELLLQNEISTVYHLAAMLSATAEKFPLKAWELNMQSLLYFLELAKKQKFNKLFFPSSIAVFGNDAPKVLTPQNAALNPSTVYGISKVSGELWCKYYFEHFGVDCRSIRYPGLISWNAQAGGGTTDYAVEIFSEAIHHKHYTSYISENTYLPMMYMEDAIRATITLMESPVDAVRIRSSYNLGGMSFSPKELAAEIKKEIPEFEIEYRPDFRQEIADNWPNSIDDSRFRNDIGFSPRYDLSRMTKDIIAHLSPVS